MLILPIFMDENQQNLKFFLWVKVNSDIQTCVMLIDSQTYEERGPRASLFILFLVNRMVTSSFLFQN